MREPIEDLVDRRQRLQLDVGVDLALGAEREGLRHVLAVADERAAHGDTAREHVEQRDRELAGRDPGSARSCLVQIAEELELRRRWSDDEHLVVPGERSAISWKNRCASSGCFFAPLGPFGAARGEAWGVPRRAVACREPHATRGCKVCVAHACLARSRVAAGRPAAGSGIAWPGPCRGSYRQPNRAAGRK